MLSTTNREWTAVAWLRNTWLLAAILAFSLTLWTSVGFYHLSSLALLTGALILTILAMTDPDRKLHIISIDRGKLRPVFIGVLTVFVMVGAARIHFRKPVIDVLIYQSDDVHALLHGTDPYIVSHADPYDPALHFYANGFASSGRILVGYPYLPLSLLWVVPGYALGDVRYSHLLAVALASLLIFWMGENIASFLAGIFLLAGPRTQTVLTNSWTEPLMVLTLALAVYCALRHPRWLPVALGLFFASKQYSLLAVPVVPFLLPEYSWKKSLKLLLQAGIVTTVITAPFAFWNVSAFWHDTALFHMSQPFRPDALSYSALLFRLRGTQIPPLADIIITACALVLILKYVPRTPAGFACAVAFLTAVFFAFSKQAFLNYYFFVVAAQCIGLAALNDGGRCSGAIAPTEMLVRV